MSFKSVDEAIKYVREMSEDATAAIGDAQVWQFDGEVVIATDDELSEEDKAEGQRLGTVAERLY